MVSFTEVAIARCMDIVLQLSDQIIEREEGVAAPTTEMELATLPVAADAEAQVAETFDSMMCDLLQG